MSVRVHNNTLDLVPHFFSKAVDHHQSGRWDESEKLYKTLLSLDPVFTDGWQFFGVMACQNKNLKLGLLRLLRAIKGDPHPSTYWNNLAIALRDSGNFYETQEGWKTSIILSPELSESYAGWSSLLQSLIDWSPPQKNDAMKAGHRATLLDPDKPKNHYNHGIVLFRLDKNDLAIRCWKKALCLVPLFLDALTNLGVAIQKKEQRTYALKLYRWAILVHQDNYDAHYNSGKAHQENDQAEQAIRFWRQTILLKPDHAQSYSNQGGLLGDVSRPQEGLWSYHCALKINPHFIEAYSNLGVALHGQNYFEEAHKNYQKALILNPTFLDATYNRSLTYLTQGNYKKGWEAYESRWDTPLMSPGVRDFAVPQWRGEEGHGRRLFIHGEQGFGDIIQFCRYVPLIANKGWHVIFEIRPSLKRLMMSLPSIDHFVIRGESLPLFDFHCPLLSLPLAFGTEIKTIPYEGPYLKSDPDDRVRWNNKLRHFSKEGKIKIGLVWAGNPAHLSPCDKRRSFHPSLLTPLLSREDFIFISLQKGGTSIPSNLPILDFMADIEDFSDTAALIDELDLVISVDTAVAHLAGALGKKLWLLDRFDSCWRWLRERNDSPWYPSCEIFRQTKAGDWLEVINRVKIKLDEDYL